MDFDQTWYIVLRRVWNPIDFQGQGVKFLPHNILVNQWPWPLTLKINRVSDSPKYVPSLIKIHWRMLIRVSTRMLCGKNLTPWPSLGESGTLLIFKVKGQCHLVKFLPHNILVNTLESTSFNGFWPNLVHSPYIEGCWFECPQGCYAVKIWPLDLWPWKSIGFQILLRTKYVPTLYNQHSSMDFWYIVLRRVWNPIDFQGHRSMSPGQIFTA
jgi:hypothetical protein